MTDLIARLERGPGSRELSDECLLAVGWKSITPGGRPYIRPDGKDVGSASDIPDPSQNLQDSLDWLVPEHSSGNKATFLQATMHQTCVGDIPDEQIASVVCAASLRARKAIKDE